MKDAQKPERFSLGSLIDKLREGRFVIPDFQREFEWSPKDVRELLKSIFLDYYIGTLLLWKGKPENFKALSCVAIYGHEDESKRNEEFIVLDGQQRLAAIYYACFAPNKNFPKRKNPFSFFVRIRDFIEDRADVAFSYQAMNLRKWQQLLADREKQFEQHVFPFEVIGAGRFAVPNWMQDYERYWQGRANKFVEEGSNEQAEKAVRFARDAREFGHLVTGLIQDYQISYIELDKDIGVEKVCDIFTQINSRGMPLDIFDLLNAMLRPKQIYLRTELWRAAKPRLEFIESKKVNVYILQSMSILLQAYNSPRYLYFLLPGAEKPIRLPDGSHGKVVLVSDKEAFEKYWNNAVTGLEGVIKVLRNPRDYGAIAPSFIPYPAILPVFGALRIKSQALTDGSVHDRQRKIRQWYWASVFTNRYSRSVETSAARDFLDVTAWFNDDEAQPGVIREFAARFKDLDLRAEKKGSAIYNGVFNLLVLQGGKDWSTFELPEYEALDDHHIVPASKAPEDSPDGVINSILNRTPLSADTNRKVLRDRLPNAYIKEMIETHGRQAVLDVMESHLISENAVDILLRDPLTANDFNLFLEDRRRTILQATEDLLIKQRIGLPPLLRDLDEKVEHIELAIRLCLVETLGEDTRALPGNLFRKVDERISKAATNDPLFDEAGFRTFSQKLQYFDLRELQDVIVNGSLWPQFQKRFGAKETLSQKFNQLADVRNAIRHSRTLNEVTRMEGEAAILWFMSVLGIESQRARGTK